MTALVTVGGYRVVEATLRMPYQGAWVADLVSDEAPTTIAGAVSLVAPGATLAGFVVPGRAGAYTVGLTYRTSLRVVGGAGGLSAPGTPKSYRAIAPAALLTALCSAAGERASSTVSLASSALPAWMRSSESAGAALDALTLELAADAWRVLDEGSIWLGSDTWPVSALDAADPPATQLEIDSGVGWALYAVDAWSVRPGQTVGGARVSAVEHRMDTRGLRTEVRYA